MDILPNDITTNILSWLPIRYLLQCRCVCKTWCSLISEPRFAEIHLNRANQTNPTNIVVEFHSNFGTDRTELYLLEDNEKEGEFGEPSIRALRIDVPFIESPFKLIGSCNGLLCLHSNHNINDVIYIINPATGQHIKLPDPAIPFRQRYKTLFGFGFSVSTQEFKVLNVIFYHNFESQALDSIVRVCTVGSSSWRMLGDAPESLNWLIFSWTFCNGSLHWTTFSPDDGTFFSKMVIVSFDFSVEEFGFLPKPQFHESMVSPRWSFAKSYGPLSLVYMNRQQNHPFPRYFQLGVLDGCLFLADNISDPYAIDIWVMKSYNVEESWVKEISIPKIPPFWLRHGIDVAAYIRNSGKIFPLNESEDLISYNAESRKGSFLQVVGVQKYSDLKARRHLTSFLAFSHVGSLISPKSVSVNNSKEILQKQGSLD